MGQFEASLCMLNESVQKCPEEHWDGKIAKYAFWQVAYDTLCFVDLYLSPNDESFQLRDFHPQGWSEFKEEFPADGSTRESSPSTWRFAGRREERPLDPKHLNLSNRSRGSIDCHSHEVKCIYTTSATCSITPVN